MAEPTRYSLTYDFTSFQGSNPSTPLPADRIEIEFQNISTTTDQIIDNLNLLQKSDGTLANGIVKVENLATELTIGLESPTAWANGTGYTVNQTVIEANVLYRCVTAHTASVFSADLASGYWVEIADYAAFLSDAETAKDAAEAAQTAAEAAQAAAEGVYDDFDDRYLGSKTSDPTLDNDGDALAEGALYWNSTNNIMRVYNGTAWGDATAATNLPIFVYTATGGETSLSGADDNSSVLAYTPGKIQVFKNGTGITQDVTADTGTSITGISPALSASDVVEIYAFESVAVLNDISSHSLATPLRTDYLLFQDVSDSNLDRRATVEDVLLADGVAAQATSDVITADDIILFGDESDSNSTKRDTVQGILDLVADQTFASDDITGQTEVVVAADDVIVFSDTDDSGNLKKDTVQGVVDLAQDINALTTNTVATGDLVMVGDVDDANNPKQTTVADIIGLVSVSQGQLNTTTGSFSLGTLAQDIHTGSSYVLYTSNYNSHITLPGGQYGLTIRSDSNYNGEAAGWWYGNDSTGKVAGAYPWQYSFNGRGATTCYGDQLYINSSPPFDLGDGEVQGFLFLLLDSNGEPQGHYFADVPPWGYNGPTEIMACGRCKKTGEKVRRVPKKLSFEEMMDGAPQEYEFEIITQEIKNRDMALIPQPFGDQSKTGLTAVLVDPMDEKIGNLLRYGTEGHDELSAMMKKGVITADNTNLKRKGPKKVGIHKLKIK